MESFFAKLKQDLQCCLCNNKLTDPKLLQCFHTFCKSCIQGHAQLKEQVHIFNCPNCSSETLLQELNNVEDLQPSPLHSRKLQVLAFSESEKSCSVSATHSPALWHCFDCDRSLCDECLKCHTTFTKDHQVVSLSDMEKEDLESMLKSGESPCKTHSNSKLEFFCKDCDVLVCLLCLKDDHKNHKTLTLQEFVAFEKDSLSINLENIAKLRSNELEKKEQEEIALKMKSDGEKAKEEVKKITKTLVKRLVNKEQQFLNQIQRNVAKADMNLRIIRHIPAAQEYIKNIIANGIASAEDMLDTKNYTYNPYKSNTVGMVFSPNGDLDNHVMDTELGHTRFTCKSNPILSAIHVGMNSSLEATKKAKLSVVTKHSTGNLNYDDCDVVDIQISPADDVKVEEKTVKTDGKIEVVFMPRVPGQLTAEVKLNGNPVSNSPLVMDVKPQEMKESKESKLKTALNSVSGNFTGIAVNKTNSRIAVADCSLHCVRVFNMDGELLLMYGCGKGSDQGQLLKPRGLAFLNDVDLVIVDSDNNRLCVVNTLTGTLVRTFGCQGNGNGEFCNPRGVHVDNNSNVIVSDSGNGRIQVFTKDGDYQYQFTVPNQDNFSPHSTVTHNGLFYVSDCNNAVIHVIQIKDGSPLRISTIGEKGVGQLQSPRGLAIDTHDNHLLVCDYVNRDGVVNKFTLDGRFVGKTCTLYRQTFNPLYIEVQNDGQFIVTVTSSTGLCSCSDFLQFVL